jgi:2-keto-4-pentenoate hydratase/2-oxohepta-3-ene-1,7-dioic acid hydratase in catechol pathway
MKLLRYGAPGAERPGLLDSTGKVRDLGDRIRDIDGDFLAGRGIEALRSVDPDDLPAVENVGRLGPCIGGQRSAIGIGLNYKDHAEEAGLPTPTEPVVFLIYCPPTGPNDPVTIPKGSAKVDWEVELGVVIGREAQHVEEAEALDHVAGYCVVNDVSERGFQFERGGDWSKGKSSAGFLPTGPWLVTRDEIPDPQRLDMWLEVNGKRYQQGSTSMMIFGVATIVSYLSRFMTLYPGDLIATGTPAGVGFGIKPEPVFLRDGDVVRLGIDGLGEQRQAFVAWKG